MKIRIIANNYLMTEAEFKILHKEDSIAFPLDAGMQTYYGVRYQVPPAEPDSHIYTWVLNNDGTYTTTPRDPAVIAAEDAEVAAAAQRAADIAAAKAYAKLVTLQNMTPAEVQAWVEANITTLATTKDMIKTLAVAVGILARRL